MRIVPGFDKLENGHSGYGLGLETSPVDRLTLQGGKEALAQGVVEAVSDRTGGRPHPGLPASFPEVNRSVLASLIGMVDHGGRAALPQGHIQGSQNQFRPEVRFHRPSTIRREGESPGSAPSMPHRPFLSSTGSRPASGAVTISRPWWTKTSGR